MKLTSKLTLILFSVLVVATGLVLAGERVIHPDTMENPFRQYRELTPGNTRPTDGCRNVYIPVSIYEPLDTFYCIFDGLTGTISSIGVYGNTGYIRNVRFNVNLRYGDLVGWFGNAESVTQYYGSRYYHWNRIGISAYGRSYSSHDPMRTRILYVHYRERN